MFRRYNIKWGDGHTVTFYVNSRPARNGFIHRACVIGVLPRLDDTTADISERSRNTETLNRKRMTKVHYLNRTWEVWPGQTCLSKLWEQLKGLKFLDMAQISLTNPFQEDSLDMEMEELLDPDDVFSRF